MKKTVQIFLLVALLIVLGLGVLKLAERPIDAAAAKGHLVWDYLDKVYYCLGTPTNCAFAE
jgi:hypothetical protein